MEKFLINLIILAGVICFGYHAVNNIMHSNFDMAAVNLIIAAIIAAVGKSIKKSA